MSTSSASRQNQGLLSIVDQAKRARWRTKIVGLFVLLLGVYFALSIIVGSITPSPSNGQLQLPGTIVASAYMLLGAGVVILDPHEFTEADEIALVSWDEAAVALAFGLVKLHGSAPTEAIDLALQAIGREREATAALGYALLDERVAAMARLESRLRDLR